MGREGEADMTFAKHNALLQSAVIWNAVVKCFYVYCLLERILDLFLWFLLLHGYCMVHLGVENPDGSLSFLHKHSMLIISWSTSLMQHNWQPNLVHPSVGRMQDWQLKISGMLASTTTKKKSGNSYPSIFVCFTFRDSISLSRLAHPLFFLPTLYTDCCSFNCHLHTACSQIYPTTLTSHHAKLTPQVLSSLSCPDRISSPRTYLLLKRINPFPLSSSLG